MDVADLAGVPRDAVHRRNLQRATVLSLLLVTCLAVPIGAWGRWGPDWPAQEFRAWTAAQGGLASFTTRWYGGTDLLGYSVLYPLIAGIVGAAVVGVLSCLLITWAACGLAPRTSRLWLGMFAGAVAVSVLQNLLIGQIPFLLGAAFALVALRCGVSGTRPAVVAGAAALASLASPMAGVFLLLTVPAVGQRWGVRRALPLGAAVTGSAVAAVVGGAGGWFPFPFVSLIPVLVFCLLLGGLPGIDRTIRIFALTYGLAAVAAFLVPDPVGGNIARLGKIIAIPMACYVIATAPRSRRLVAVILGALAIAWPSVAVTSSAVQGAGDPSQNASYYTGLDDYLRTHMPADGRLEIPFTREHWESYFVARQFPIARGWDRQSDLVYNAVLYNPLTPASYRRWLDDNAVDLVALPSAPIDYGGRAEADLLSHAPAYLVPVWHDANWRVWAVRDPAPLITGPATVTGQGLSSIDLSFDRPGTATVRIRGSALWRLQVPAPTASSCVGQDAGGWLTVHSDHAGRVDLTASFSLGAITGASACPVP